MENNFCLKQNKKRQTSSIIFCLCKSSHCLANRKQALIPASSVNLVLAEAYEEMQPHNACAWGGEERFNAPYRKP